MTIAHDGRAPPRGRPGPKPRGRTVVPLTITVTHAQRAALDARADTERVSISTIVRRFIAAGLVATLFLLSAPIATTIPRRSGAGARLGSKGATMDAHTLKSDARDGRDDADRCAGDRQRRPGTADREHRIRRPRRLSPSRRRGTWTPLIAAVTRGRYGQR